MFFDNFVKLCNSVGKTPSAVVQELGMAKSAVTNWKKRGNRPTEANLRKIADYFGVTIDYLLNGEPTETKKDEITYDDFTYAMYGHSRELTEEQKQLLLKLAEDMRGRRGL